MGSESNPPAFAVTVCGNGSLLIQTIESPAFDRDDRRRKGDRLHRDRMGDGPGRGRRAGAAARQQPRDGEGEEQRASHDGARDYFDSDDWTILAWSRWATNAGRTFTSSAFSSAFDAFGISVLSSASSTCW